MREYFVGLGSLTCDDIVIWCSLYRFCRVPSSAPHQLRPLLQLWLSSIQQGIDSRTGTISSLFVRYCWGLDGFLWFSYDFVLVDFERFWCNSQFARLHQVWSCTSFPALGVEVIVARIFLSQNFKLRFKHYVDCTRRFHWVSMFINFGLHQKNHLFASGLAGVDPSTIDDLRFVWQQDTTGESGKWHLILWIHRHDPGMPCTQQTLSFSAKQLLHAFVILWQCCRILKAHRQWTKIRIHKTIDCWSKNSCTDMEIMRSCDCGSEFHLSWFLSRQNRPGVDRILQSFKFFIQISFDDTSIQFHICSRMFLLSDWRDQVGELRDLISGHWIPNWSGKFTVLCKFVL